MIRWTLLLLAACAPGGDTGDSAADGPIYPLDDVLRFSDLQAKGTHNSYHVQTADLPEWRYTHPPLDAQLEQQGVRQFELDVWFDEEAGRYEVFHIPFLDEGTTCRALVDCLAALKGWSDANPGHHPLFVLIETKDGFEAGREAWLDALDGEVLSVWPEDRLVTPALVRGDAPTVRDALATGGWPVLGALRGRALFVLHDGGGWRDAYVAAGERPLFPDAMGDLGRPWAAVHTMNDPYDPDIAAVVDAGHLVRTRADADTVQARSGDTSQRDRALESGAHFVSTDFPAPVDWTSYQVEIPGGTPSRCNPRTAPPECTARDVEDLP